MDNAYQLRQDFKLDTMDIVVAVLLGVVQAVIEIVGLLGFLERMVWATGPLGFTIYAFYNGTTWILFYAGAYLRKRAVIVVLAVAVTALVRWFAGDPDGPVLMFYGLVPAACGAMVIALMRWRGGLALFAFAVSVTSTVNQIAMFIGMGGFQLAGGTSWALISMVVAAFGGLLWGIVALHLGRSLENAGVPSLDSPPALSGGRGENA
jgi:ABC-type thiamin/hydroxymethylpyrimidine transport system permease subunit